MCFHETVSSLYLKLSNNRNSLKNNISIIKLFIHKIYEKSFIFYFKSSNNTFL